METKADIIETILDLELEMFLSVPSDGERSCQQHPEGFKFHRRMQFTVWSHKTLDSYRKDLLLAHQTGENLMTVKYARIQGLLPRRNANPLIEEILRLKLQWQKEMIQRYPSIMGNARPLTGSSRDDGITSFATYARGELETYSDATLKSLYDDFSALQKKGINASEKIYRLQARHSGFDSLESAEARMKKRNGN